MFIVLYSHHDVSKATRNCSYSFFFRSQEDRFFLRGAGFWELKYVYWILNKNLKNIATNVKLFAEFLESYLSGVFIFNDNFNRKVFDQAILCNTLQKFIRFLLEVGASMTITISCEKFVCEMLQIFK